MDRIIIYTLLALLLFAFSEESYAQAELPTYICEDCRDANEHPEDFRNFAGNTIRFGQAADLNDIDQFVVINLDGQRVVVDVEWQFRRFGFEGFSLPVWPAWTYEIMLSLPNGDFLRYTMHRLHEILPVPYPDGDSHDSPTDNSGSSGSGGSGGEGEDESDYDDGEFYEWPEIEEEPCESCDLFDWNEDNSEWEESEWMDEEIEQ